MKTQYVHVCAGTQMFPVWKAKTKFKALFDFTICYIKIGNVFYFFTYIILSGVPYKANADTEKDGELLAKKSLLKNSCFLLNYGRTLSPLQWTNTELI